MASTSHLLFLCVQLVVLVRISLAETACLNEQFSCGHYCIPLSKLCDGHVDCTENGEDEVNCECDGFHCTDGTCISASQKCDGYYSCPDRRDEDNCCLTNDRFQCDNGRCILSAFLCNDVNDCMDNSDEKNCDCGSEEFQCQDNTCVLETSTCDFMPDCSDREDEDMCDWCSPGEHPCMNYGVCYTDYQRCDGVNQCPHGEDENNCMFLTGTAEVGNGSQGVLRAKLSGIKYAGVCAEGWSEELADIACANMGFERSHQQWNSFLVNSAEPGRHLVVNRTEDGAVLANFVPGECNSNLVVWLACSQKTCGQRPLLSSNATSHSPYIVNGELAEAGAWPWQVRLYYAGTFGCGGTLLNHHWVLTAAHCIYSYDFDCRQYAKLLTIEVGVTDSSLLYDPNSRRYTVDSCRVYPLYYQHNGDVGLLYISESITFTDYVQPACMPDSDEEVADNLDCYITGWGRLRGTSTGHVDILRQVKVNSLDERSCVSVTDGDFNPLKQLCVGSLTGFVSACYGDSGGPLVCRDVTDTWKVMGVTSYGVLGCTGPSIYMSVPYYKSWIERQMP